MLTEEDITMYSHKHGWLTVDLYVDGDETYAVEYRTKYNSVRFHKKSLNTKKLNDISIVPRWLLAQALSKWPD